MRIFVAAEVPAAVREALAQAQQRLKAGWSSMRWSSPDTMHLTIRFLGDLDDRKTEALREALRQSLRPPAAPGCQVRVRGLGVFPDARRARVLWAGLEDEPPGSLARLHGCVEQAVSAAGLPGEERPFHPHLTLARTGEGRPPSTLASVLAGMKDVEFGTFRVEALRVFQSLLKPTGARHLCLEEYGLA